MSKISNLFTSINLFFTNSQGLYERRPFVVAMQLWPICTAVLFGSYWFSGDRRPLGDLQWVWASGRFMIVIMSVACLVFQSWVLMREWLGHSIMLYAYFVCVAYWIAVPVHDALFWGDIARVVASSSALYVLTMFSVAVLKEKKKHEATLSSGE